MLRFFLCDLVTFKQLVDKMLTPLFGDHGPLLIFEISNF